MLNHLSARPLGRLSGLGLLLAGAAALLWPSVTGAQEEVALPESVAEAVTARVAQGERVGADDIEILRSEFVTWRDGCLGAAGSDEVCTLALVEGYVVWVEADDEALRYHTDSTGEQVRFAAEGIDPADVDDAPLPEGAEAGGIDSPDGARYTVQSGDVLWQIAARFGTSVAAIVDANNIADPNVIEVGQQLVIPGGPTEGSDTPDGDGDDVDGATYTVQSGDTLAQIAARFGSTVSAIASANDIANPNVIEVGQVVVIPGDEPPADGDRDGAGATYTVQSGDTLFSIAQRFGTTVSEIAAENGIANVNVISVGQVLTIPGAGGGAEDGEDDGLVAGECSNDRYSVAVPDGWFANDGSVTEPCRFFDPTPFEVEPATDLTTAITVPNQNATFDEAVERVNESETLNVISGAQASVDGQEAYVIESENTEGALFPQGTRSYRYLIEMPNGDALAFVTYDLDEYDYAANQSVLDDMMESLEFAAN